MQDGVHGEAIVVEAVKVRFSLTTSIRTPRLLSCCTMRRRSSRLRASRSMLCTTTVSPPGLVARAEMLYNREGIQLQRTTRIVTYKAGVCNVLEDLHSEKVYELKANHGQPLHVCQRDFSAYNGTGKPLSHLRAGFEIESAWPPCRNWSGPPGSYAKQIE